MAPVQPGGRGRGRWQRELQQAISYRPDESVVDRVNAAVLLRRPLLVMGKPGSGKSTLAYNVAYELGLGSVLYWSITSNTTLQTGLYDYDAIGRLHETSLRGAGGREDTAEPPDIGRYIRLGPLGTALLPGDQPASCSSTSWTRATSTCRTTCSTSSRRADSTSWSCNGCRRSSRAST